LTKCSVCYTVIVSKKLQKTNNKHKEVVMNKVSELKRKVADQLQDSVQSIADEITDGIILNAEEHEDILEETGQEPGEKMTAAYWMDDALDFEYVISRDGDYRGGSVLVAFGGPNIWVNTMTGQVEGYWGSDRATANFIDGIGLDDYLENLWLCR